MTSTARNVGTLLSTPTSRTLAALIARVERHEQRIGALERRRGPRDPWEAALPEVLARAIGSRRFSSAELHAHARVDPALARALVDARLTTIREIGCALAGLRDVLIDGRIIRRHGRRWAVHLAHLEMSGAFGDTLPPS